MDVRKIKAVDL